VERFHKTRRKYRKAEQYACDDTGGGQVVHVKRDGSDVAGTEAGEGVWVHVAERPHCEINPKEEASGRGEHSSENAQGRYFAEEAAGDQADCGVPDPGCQISAKLEWKAIDDFGQIDVCESHDCHSYDGLPAGAARPEEEQTGTDCGEVDSDTMHRMRKQTA